MDNGQHTDHSPKQAGPDSQAIAAELRAASARHRVTQVDVAAAIGRSQSYVSLRWNGQASLLVDELVAWCGLVDEKPADVVRRARYALAADKGYPDGQDENPDATNA